MKFKKIVPCNDHRTVFASPLSAVFIVGVYKLKRESAIGSVCANLSSLKASVEHLGLTVVHCM